MGGGPLGSFGDPDEGVSFLDRLDTLTAYVEVFVGPPWRQASAWACVWWPTTWSLVPVAR